ncbi:uncharacterized protein DUF3883 [Stella humosa]|uniref:Uncharacterized protein DUF3883 n=1 Tax=Stella humosa TaxID=94 RepID=A0A3N1MCM2_9PROT|nr:uncharacterized protein DUF3883 [Stella humosa]
MLATTQTTDLGGSGDWTPAEMNAAIDSYLQMLRKELAGESYSKTEYRLALAGTIARPEGAIERKHQNISAILSERGLPWIRGYLPSAHYQQSLTVLLLEALAGLSPIGAVDEVPQPKLLSFDELIVPPPQLPPRSPTRGNTRTAAPGTLAQREAMNRTLGRAGEKYILEVEQQRLRAAGRPDLAARVRWVSELDGDGAGYDISSFSNEGQPLRIEVKTTLQNINTPFYLTAHELRTAAELEGTYRLFRLFNFGKAPRMYQLSGPLESALNLSPILYRADPTCIPGPEHQPGPPDADAFGL